MFNKKFVRIIAIILAVLLGGSVLAGAITAFAADAETEAVLLSVPATGDHKSPLPIVIGVVAVVLVIACIVVPKINKKGD